MMGRKQGWMVRVILFVAGLAIAAQVATSNFTPLLAQVSNFSPSPRTSVPLPPPPAAAPTPPLPLQGEYRDPAGRFKVGILQGYKVSPLAGSVLIESLDGYLAYSVTAQAQSASPAPTQSLDATELARIAVTLLQRGEGFQPGQAQPEAGGGITLPWSGTLTLGNTTQPVGGTILVRPATKHVLLLLITATQTGGGRVPGALSALASSLQPL